MKTVDASKEARVDDGAAPTEGAGREGAIFGGEANTPSVLEEKSKLKERGMKRSKNPGVVAVDYSSSDGGDPNRSQTAGRGSNNNSNNIDDAENEQSILDQKMALKERRGQCSSKPGAVATNIAANSGTHPIDAAAATSYHTEAGSPPNRFVRKEKKQSPARVEITSSSLPDRENKFSAIDNDQIMRERDATKDVRRQRAPRPGAKTSTEAESPASAATNLGGANVEPPELTSEELAAAGIGISVGIVHSGPSDVVIREEVNENNDRVAVRSADGLRSGAEPQAGDNVIDIPNIPDAELVDDEEREREVRLLVEEELARREQQQHQQSVTGPVTIPSHAVVAVPDEDPDGKIDKKGAETPHWWACFRTKKGLACLLVGLVVIVVVAVLGATGQFSSSQSKAAGDQEQNESAKPPEDPTSQPSTPIPSAEPSLQPSIIPSSEPSAEPSMNPSLSISPSVLPSEGPTPSPKPTREVVVAAEQLLSTTCWGMDRYRPEGPFARSGQSITVDQDGSIARIDMALQLEIDLLSYLERGREDINVEALPELLSYQGSIVLSIFEGAGFTGTRLHFQDVVPAHGSGKVTPMETYQLTTPVPVRAGEVYTIGLALNISDLDGSGGWCGTLADVYAGGTSWFNEKPYQGADGTFRVGMYLD